MNFLCDGQSLQHDEEVGEQDESPDPNICKSQEGIVPNGDFCLTSVAAKGKVPCSCLLVNINHFLVTLCALDTFVQDAIVLKKRHRRF